MRLAKTWNDKRGRTSALEHKYAPFQQDKKRSAARRASERLAVANLNELNNADGRLLSCPSGATQMGHCGVAALDKGLPFPADCALH